MLRMSRLTDYGILLLAHLAAGNAQRNARELSEETGLPGPAVSKLLKRLAREGFLESQRGTKGGYALAMPAEQISVAAVIDALEGPIALTECSAHPGVCERESRCQVRAPWQRINLAVRRTLEHIHLSELVAQPFGLPATELLAKPGAEASS